MSDTTPAAAPPASEQVDEGILQEFRQKDFEQQVKFLVDMFQKDIISPVQEAYSKVLADEKAFEEEKAKHRDPNAKDEDIIKLDIGGKIFDVKRKVLCRVKGTKLEAIFNGNFKVKTAPKNGATFIDRDPTHFHIIVRYLEEKPYQEIFPSDVIEQKRFLNELQWYKMEELSAEFSKWTEEGKKAK
eukprot:TRINITY_DN77541_c0_g1_i1.p1 TRINITY_DN77541_c0_g1~~TRINITY_DN77541_c0_g1_i1.p1  ORF type:complete len:186 (+),score=57.10 TRINITY_DN77541_c0_g1_i1:51-608(+)